MNGLCRLSRISTALLKASAPKSRLLHPRIVASSKVSFCKIAKEKNLLLQQFGTKKCIKPYVSVERIVRQLSTSSALLSSHKSHDHSKIWTLERGLAIGLLGTVPAALLYPCQALDTAMALLIVAHTHFGLEAIIVDYIRPILFGPVAPKIGIALLYVFSVATLAGLLNLIYNDCGLANTIIGVCKK